MATQKNIIELVNRFVKDIKNEGVHLRKAFLFGSYARNMQHRYSDIDVALVADEFDGFLFKDLDLFINAKTKKTYSRIQVQTYHTDYFKKGDPFIEQILKTGIEIKLP